MLQSFATARQDNSAQLKELVEKSTGRVKFVQLDIAIDSSAEEAAFQLEKLLDGASLDVLINNAGLITWMTEGIDKMSV